MPLESGAHDFGGNTVYTAQITITPKAGFTLDMVPQNFFKVEGAVTTNAAGSGVITAKFPITAPLPMYYGLPPLAISETKIGERIPYATIQDTELLSTYSIDWYPRDTYFEAGTSYIAYIKLTHAANRNLYASFGDYYSEETGVYAYYDYGADAIAVYYPETDRAIEKQNINVPAPQAGQRAVKKIETEQFVADISWNDDDDVFNADTFYEAIIQITPKLGYVFLDQHSQYIMGNDYFTVSGGESLFDEQSKVVRAMFPKTKTTLYLSIPQTMIAGGEQVEYGSSYSTMKWHPNTGIFLPGISYTAILNIHTPPGSDKTVYGMHFTAPGANVNVTMTGPYHALAQVWYPQLPPLSSYIVPTMVGLAPVTGEVPKTSYSDYGYSASITWSPSATTFAADTTYTATINITPQVNYFLPSLPANFFNVIGANTSTNAAYSGIVTAVFPPTGKSTIRNSDILGITAPETEETPVSMIDPTDEYTATISWSPAITTTFVANTAYTATVTITPKPGYTLMYVPQNFFQVAGAMTTNEAGSGTVRAVFSATEAYPRGIMDLNAATSALEVRALLEETENIDRLDLWDHIDAYISLTTLAKLLVADALFNGGTDYTTIAEVKTAFGAAVAEVAASAPSALLQTIEEINEASSVEQLLTILDSEHAALSVEYLDYYRDLDEIGRLNVLMAILEGIPYPADDTWPFSERFQKALFHEVLVQNLNAIESREEFISEFFVSQNSLDLNFTLLSPIITASFACESEIESDCASEREIGIANQYDELMLRRPFTTIEQIRAAFLDIFISGAAAESVSAINESVSAEEVRQILEAHYATEFGITSSWSTFYIYHINESQRAEIATALYNSGADYANAAEVKAALESISASYSN